MEPFTVPVLIKKVASGEKTHKDLTRDEARWILGMALEGRLSDVQLGALLSALRLKGETAGELAGFLEAVENSGSKLDPAPAPAPLVAHCGATSGKGHYFMSAPGAALLAAAAGVRVCICARSGAEVKFPLTEIDIFRALGVPTGLPQAAVANVLAETGVAVLEQTQIHPALARLSALQKPLGMRTVAQSVEKFIFPIRPTAALVSAFHLNYLRRLAEAAAGTFAFRLILLQERDGATDPLPVHATGGLLVQNGQVSPWSLTPAGAGIERQDPSLLPAIDCEKTAAVMLELLNGQRSGPHREMLLYGAGLLIHAGFPERPVSACVGEARRLLDEGAGRDKLDQLRRATAPFRAV